MARPKKTTPKATPKKTTARGKAKTQDKAQMSADLKTQTAQIKLLKGTDTKRPPNNPDMPQNIIDMLNQDFNSIKELRIYSARNMQETPISRNISSI